MMYGNVNSIPAGGACAFQLAAGPRSASLARSLLREAMSTLDLPDELIEDGVLAVSELATNAHQHVERAGLPEPITLPELWIWSRRHPAHQLVISVFDADRDHLPESGVTGVWEERGRGLDIVAGVTAACGARLSRCRLGAWLVPGKVVWFALPLPGPYDEAAQDIPPALAGHRLVKALATRGIDARQRSDHDSICVVTVANIVVLIDPKSFSWNDPRHGQVRLPLADLHETAERLIERLEEDGTR